MPKGKSSEVMDGEDSSAEGITCEDMGFDIEANIADLTPTPASSHQADL